MNLSPLKKICEKHTKLILLIIFVLSSITVCFFGHNSDESGWNALAYQIATGDKFLKEIWTLFFFPELLVAPIMWIYIKLASGTDGVILFLRILGCVISATVSFSLYGAIKKISSKNIAFWSALAFFLFSPSNFACPNYKNISIWGIMLTSICFVNYTRNPKPFTMVCAGLFSVVGIMGYPTTGILVPYLVFLSIYITCKASGNKRHRFVYSISLVVSGLVFLSAVIFVTDIGSLNNLSKVFESDFHHTHFFDSVLNALKAVAIGLLRGALPFFAIDYFGKKLVDSSNRTLGRLGAIFINSRLVFLIYFFGFSVVMFSPLFGVGLNSMAFPVAMAFFAILFFYKQSKLENKKLLFLIFGVVPAICAFTIFFTSNQAYPIVWIMPLISALPFLFMLINGSEYKGKANEKLLMNLICCSVCLFMLFTRTFFVVNTGSRHDSLRHPKKMIDFGPAKHMLVLEEYYDLYYAQWDLIKQHCVKGDNVLIAPSNKVGYLMSDIKVSESIFNVLLNSTRVEQFLEANPHRVPKLVIVGSEDSLEDESYLKGMLERDYQCYIYNDDFEYYLKK